jgi:predicted transcriptional regulator
MHIDLPQHLINRIQKHAAKHNATPVELIDQALDALDWQDQEVQAVREGLDDMHAGRVTPIRKFDAEYRAKYRLPPADL